MGKESLVSDYIDSCESVINLNLPSQFVKSENTVKSHVFAFEQIFGVESDQAMVFSQVEELVQSMIDGQ